MTNVIDLGLARTYRADSVVVEILAALSANDRALARELLVVAHERLHGIPQGPRRRGMLRTLRVMKKYLKG
jgi:hypothetical protein